MPSDPEPAAEAPRAEAGRQPATAPATRLIGLDDAPVLAGLLRDNRDFMAPFEPARVEGYFTASGQLALIRDLLVRHEQGRTLPHVILDEDGSVVGRITLNEIVRGPFQSCSLGYWVAASANGRGLATAAVRDIVRVAFEDLGLHRIQAGTLPDNARSQRVLERNGFVRFGLAPAYLRIAGRWQDHVLYQLLNPAQQ
jgi:ribosomal-protein-alanine N-acetyltransferase